MYLRKKRRIITKKEKEVFSYLPQCDVGGYNVDPAPQPDPQQPIWDMAGIHTKMEKKQMVDASFFPNPYNYLLSGQANSVFGQLDRFTWYKGIQYTLIWAKAEPTPGNFSEAYFGEVKRVLDTIRDLYTNSGRESAKNKKVMFLLP